MTRESGDKKYDNGGVPWTFATKGAGANQTVGPTALPTVSVTPLPKTTIRPTQSVKIEDGSTTPCNETDCVKICENWKAHSGCIAADLSKNGCIGKVNLGNCQLSITVTPTPSPGS